MEHYTFTPFTFRFKFLPQLEQCLLPVYQEYLRKEISSSIQLNETQVGLFESFISFLSIALNFSESKKHLYESRLYESRIYKGIIDINNFIPLFEVMEKLLENKK